MERNLAILIISGPEVKSFIYSGLLQKLLSAWEISIFTPDPEMLCFANLHKRIKILKMPKAFEAPPLQVWRYRASYLHSLWIKKLGVAKWRHYLSDTQTNKAAKARQKLLEWIVSPFWVATATRIERLFGKLQGTNAVWEKIFTDNKIDGLLTSSFSNPACITALQTASNLGINSWVTTNSWKDVFVSPHLPVYPTDVFLWRQEEVDFLRSVNPEYPSGHVHAIGSLHLAPFNNLKDLLPRDEFFTKLSLDLSRPLINYTAASPNAVKNEELIVAQLIDLLALFPENPQLLIRTNPMETSQRFEKFICKDVRVQRPDWEWKPESAWNSPSPEDMRWWLSTVYYSTFNVSISSTVTLEYARLGKPVVNICFDLPEQLPAAKSNRRFWEAPFYNEVRQSEIAIPAFDVRQLLIAMESILDNNYLPPKIPAWLKSDAVQLMTDLILLNL